MNSGAALFQSANHIQKIFKRKIGMQSADHVKFGGPGANAFRRTLINFIQREIICAGRVGIASKSAEFAMGDANIRGIDVPIYVEVANISVALFANDDSQASRRPANPASDKTTRLPPRSPFAGQNFIGDGPQAGV